MSVIRNSLDLTKVNNAAVLRLSFALMIFCLPLKTSMIFSLT